MPKGNQNRRFKRDEMCERCLEFSDLSYYQGRYLCRDCFVGDYDPEYIEWRREALLVGSHHLGEAQHREEGNGMRLTPGGKKGKKR